MATEEDRTWGWATAEQTEPRAAVEPLALLAPKALSHVLPLGHRAKRSSSLQARGLCSMTKCTLSLSLSLSLSSSSSFFPSPSPPPLGVLQGPLARAVPPYDRSARSWCPSDPNPTAWPRDGQRRRDLWPKRTRLEPQPLPPKRWIGFATCSTNAATSALAIMTLGTST